MTRKTPVRCIVRGELNSDSNGSVVTLRFGLPILPALLFWMAPLFLPRGVPGKTAICGFLVVVTVLLFAREVRLMRAMLVAVLSGPKATSLIDGEPQP
jgi:hypothetical protein